MLGKTAAGLYWMGRYLERSENVSRLLEVGFRIALTRSAAAASEWQSILTSAGCEAAYRARHDSFVSAKVIDFMLRDPANPSSLLSTLGAARDNARMVRTAITREVWEATNDSWMALRVRLKRPVREADLPDLLADIRRQNAQVRGALAGTMLRNDCYNFLRLGSFLERADNTARILDVKYYLLLPSVAHVGSSLDHVQWETILRSVSAHRSYQWLYGTSISARQIADFLILNGQMPRSLAFCCAKMQDNLGWLQREYGEATHAGAQAEALCRDMMSDGIDTIFDNGLHEYIGRFIIANNALGQQIERDYRFRG